MTKVLQTVTSRFRQCRLGRKSNMHEDAVRACPMPPMPLARVPCCRPGSGARRGDEGVATYMRDGTGLFPLSRAG